MEENCNFFSNLIQIILKMNYFLDISNWLYLTLKGQNKLSYKLEVYFLTITNANI